MTTLPTRIAPIGLLLAFGQCHATSVPPAPPPARAEQPAWRHQTLAPMDLEVDLPAWGIAHDATADRWLMLGLPLVDQPVAAAQFGITVTIAKYPKAVHDLAFPPATGNMPAGKAVNASYESTTTIALEGDVYVIRDIPAGGAVLRCIGHINKARVAPERIKEVARTISSIAPIVRPAP